MSFYLTDPMNAPPAERPAAVLPRPGAKTPIGAPFWNPILSSKYWDSDTKMAYYGHRYYGPGMGRWLSRDPIGEHATLQRHLAGKPRRVRARLQAASLRPAYLFVGNRPICLVDALGLITYDSNCDDTLSSSDRSAIDSRVNQAKGKLQDWEDGSVSLPSNLTDAMASCIKGKLDSVSLSCMSCWNPVCWVVDGFSWPNTGSIGVCVSKIKDKPGGLNGVILLVFHEIVHECGKIGHSSPNAPDDWGSWLWNPAPVGPPVL